MCSNTGENQKY